MTSPRQHDRVTRWDDHAVEVGDWALTSGGRLRSGRLHYRTTGTRRVDSGGRTTNAALLLHGTVGTGLQFQQDSFAGAMFGPSQPLDLDDWFVIAPDALGHGHSAKPSDGLRASFPAYGYLDMVHGQRLVVADAGVQRLRLVLGTSMGGMQTWLWGGLHPCQMDALVTVACEPAPITGRNLLWRRLITQAIRNDPAWAGGAYATQPTGFRSVWPVFDLMTGSPDSFASLDSVDAVKRHLTAVADSAADATDMLYALEASFDYDPRPGLPRIIAPLLAVSFASDELNPEPVSTIDTVISSLPAATHLHLTADQAPAGHRSLADGRLYAAQLAAFLGALPGPGS